jgi:SAM-dependent methyltransferase
MENYNKNRQFSLSSWDFLIKLDILNWLRYAAIIKELTKRRADSILEIGPGEGTIKNIMTPFVKIYETLDLNQKLKPTYLGDVRDFNDKIQKRYNCVIAADILEHIPFDTLEIALKNLNRYLKTGGTALITIPHRSHYFMWMTSLNHRPSILRTPTLKQLLGNPWIDPGHEWEIGDGKHKIKDVEKIMEKVGFKIEKRQKLVYVDFWILKKT